MKQFRSKRGFSLIEVVISIAVIAVVIGAVTTVVVGLIRGNRLNINRLIAVNLAEEGLEAVRNMRDSNWLQGILWTGETASSFFGEILAHGDFIVERKMPISVFPGHGIAEMNEQARLSLTRNAAPFVLRRKLTPTDAKLYLKEVSDGSFYVHDLNYPFSGFSRTIDLALEQFSEKEIRLLVTSRVEWMEGSSPKEISLTTYLTDWKKGPY